jgi:hypothetical protein
MPLNCFTPVMLPLKLSDVSSQHIISIILLGLLFMAFPLLGRFVNGRLPT